MKQLLALIAVFSFLAMGQVKFGVTAGVNMASWSGSDASDTKGLTGFAFGGFVATPGDGLGFRGEALYSMKGATVTFLGTDISMKYDYLEFPLLGKYTFATPGNIKPSFYAGPYLGFLLSSKAEANGNSADISDQKSVDFGLAFGAGADINVGNGSVGLIVRYGLGLTKINDQADIKNGCFSIMANYAF